MQHNQRTGAALILLGLLVIAGVASGSLPAMASQNSTQESAPEQAQEVFSSYFIPSVYKNAGPYTTVPGYVEHDGKLLGYVGASTCLVCHSDAVHSFASSNHFQWRGKLVAMNDFCGYANINLGPVKLETVFGTMVDSGCTVCHAGLGAKPTGTDPLDADCLVCHASDYRRTEVLMGDVWRFVPDRVNMPATISIQEKPTRYACLTCHASSGEGVNHKRGDISNKLANPSDELDVHMGNGMLCVDCHQADDHRIAGRGVDLIVDEGVPMHACTDCHSPETEHEAKIVRHLDKVACQSCHIPEFARAVSTDMLRDYRSTEVNTRGLYAPTITRDSIVIPEYVFWNGGSGFYHYGDPAVDGQLMAWPLGDIMDGKLYPFKVHQAMMPQDPVTRAILPMKSEILYETGNMDLAILTGAAEAGFDLTQGYTFTQTTRWMGIFHEMPPADQALDCGACHESTERVDFPALGYTPNETRDGEPLCISCHRSKYYPSFYVLHADHVYERHVACKECHAFSR